MKKILLIILLLPQLATAQDTIRVGHKFKNFDQLEMGTKRDAVYNLYKGEIKGLAIKTRTTEKVIINGKEYISITHTWVSPGTEWKGSFHYLCEPKTMKPVQHIRNTKRAGKEAFSFSDGKVIGLDSVSENVKAGFELALVEPTYNWEVDLETYSLLPMKKGYHVVMNFYHPGGGTPPEFYHLKVTGSEKLKLPDGKTMDCWVIFTDYGSTQPTRFWYTKKGQNFVKMEGQYNQMTIRKERIF
ncbi:MAG: hypothetical protein HEP71_08870 [Roseivirga sp.]|nr:hypothetical protein [Roseivirga sp.]